MDESLRIEEGWEGYVLPAYSDLVKSANLILSKQFT